MAAARMSAKCGKYAQGDHVGGRHVSRPRLRREEKDPNRDARWAGSGQSGVAPTMATATNAGQRTKIPGRSRITVNCRRRRALPAGRHTNGRDGGRGRTSCRLRKRLNEHERSQGEGPWGTTGSSTLPEAGFARREAHNGEATPDEADRVAGSASPRRTRAARKERARGGTRGSPALTRGCRLLPCTAGSARFRVGLSCVYAPLDLEEAACRLSISSCARAVRSRA
jgi:hypothetical protein